MIATGLCLMGGCFAQDASSLTVDAYWPTHAITLSETIILKPYGEDLLLPLWVVGLRAGGRLENVHRGSATQNNILNWGEWGTGSGVQACDALYLGYGRDNGTQGPSAYAACFAQNHHTYIRAASITNSDAFYDFIEVSACDGKFSMRSSIGDADAQPKEFPSIYRTSWQIRVRAPMAGIPFDVVSYWWVNDVVQKQFFMVQPMKSALGDNAFFTHGFNILTEI